MSADFELAYAPVRRFEGDWCDVPGDAGGETYAGIARNFFPDWPGWHLIDAAKAHPSFSQGSRTFSRHLTGLPDLENLVTAFYRAEWWDKMGLARWPQLVATELFEQAVNLGRGGSGKLLQRVCNAMNYIRRNGSEQHLFDDLKEDGAVGPPDRQGPGAGAAVPGGKGRRARPQRRAGQEIPRHRREQLLEAQIPRGLDDAGLGDAMTEDQLIDLLTQLMSSLPLWGWGVLFILAAALWLVSNTMQAPAESSPGWYRLFYALATGLPRLVKKVLERRRLQKTLPADGKR